MQKCISLRIFIINICTFLNQKSGKILIFRLQNYLKWCSIVITILPIQIQLVRSCFNHLFGKIGVFIKCFKKNFFNIFGIRYLKILFQQQLNKRAGTTFTYNTNQFTIVLLSVFIKSPF